MAVPIEVIETVLAVMPGNVRHSGLFSGVGLPVLSANLLRKSAAAAFGRELTWEEWLESKYYWLSKYTVYECTVVDKSLAQSVAYFGPIAVRHGYSYLMIDEVRSN